MTSSGRPVRQPVKSIPNNVPVFRNILPAPSQSAAVPLSPKAKIRKTYTRKAVVRKKNNSTQMNVNSGEEISIMSSSGSEKSETNSINIMSSSSSSGSLPSEVESFKGENEDNIVANDPITTATATAATKEGESSSWSTSSDSISTTQSDSNKSVESNSNSESVKSEASVSVTKVDRIKTFLKDYTTTHPILPTTPINFETIQDWERAACPSFFGQEKSDKEKALKDRRFIQLRRGINSSAVNFRENLSEAELINIILKYDSMYSRAAIKQIIDILSFAARGGDALVGTTRTDSNSTTTKTESDSNTTKIQTQTQNQTLSSTRKRKIRTEEGDWILPEEVEGRVIVHPPPKAPREKRKKRVVTKKAEEEFAEGEDPFRLILLNNFNEEQRDDDGEIMDMVKPPFSVEISLSVVLLMDLHSHLHSSEIIGLLGGTFDTDTATLRITYGHPCSTSHSTGTQVDVDPLSEMEAGEQFEGRGIKMTGWYHSHPNFEPNPSMRDLETQNMYQGLFKNSQPNSDIEPFVGIIVNPYMAITESSSHIECFYLLPSKEDDMDPSYERAPYRLALKTLPFKDDSEFDSLLAHMAIVLQIAAESPDSLNMDKKAETGGLKRIDKLLNSLQFHGQLDSNQMDRIRELLK